MTDKLVKSFNLENGLVLEIYDESKKIAADRWLVKLLAKIEIDTGLINNLGNNTINYDDIKSSLGQIIVFEKTRERNFIDENDKDEIFKSLCSSFMDTWQIYLSHKDFAEKFILKQYNDNKP